MVLAAGSKFLTVLFDGQFKDSLPPIVDTHEMDPVAFAMARCAVRDSSALKQVLSAGAVLQCDSLLTTIKTENIENVTADNSFFIMELAKCNNLPQLVQTAEIIERVVFVDTTSDPEMPGRNSLSLLQSNHLNVNSEQVVFETLSK